MFGANLRVATPATYEPHADIMQKAQGLAAQSGGRITLGNDARAAVRGADVVYTDVWVSAGQEEATVRRRADFRDFQVNMELVKLAKPDAIVLHCLPAHRGDEITDEVMDSPQCAAFEQAENRLHTQRGLLTLMLG
jgi:ornithine carbamoyltransferase